MLREVDALHAKFADQTRLGRVPENSLDALRIELTYHSNAIEGSTLTLRETQLVIEGHAPTSGKSLREVYEARNHDRALRTIESWARNRSDHHIMESDLLAVHAMVLADIDEVWRGRYRDGRVLIKGTRFVPPSPLRFPELVPSALARANATSLHALVQAAELHYNLVAVHPFNDGNGRTARLMMNWQLLRRGFPICVIEVERRAEYLSALERANAGDPLQFGMFIVQAARRTLQRLLGDE
jgi:Fic family protein